MKEDGAMRVASLLTVCILAVGAITRGAPEQDGARTIVVYALATGAQNAPVTDLTLADFTIKEDNRIREVTSVEPATAPLHVAVIVDDNGSGIFRFGVNNFAQRVQGRAEMSLRVVNGQVRTITEFTSDTQIWIAGISQLGVRPANQDGGQLLEGIADAAKSFAAREARRPVILALTVGGQEHSTLIGRDVLDQIHRSRAALYVVYAGNAAIRAQAAATRPSDLLGGNHNLDEVLGDGPKQSGGRRRDVIATQALVADIPQIATELSAQYAITYRRPAERNVPQRIQITVQRRDVNVVAPTRAPLR
jgi:VWFA-related protein